MKLLLLFLGVICYRKAASAPAAEKIEEELSASLPLVLTDKALEGGANELLAEPVIKILPYLGEEKAKALKELGENYQHTAVRETNGPEAQILPKPIAVGEPNGGKKIDFSLDGYFYKGKKKIASYRIDFKGVIFKKNRDQENPCNLIDCKEGTVCELQEMACIPERKCPPQPKCVPVKTGPSCKTIKCMANHTCVDLPTGSKCQPIEADPCALVDCKEGTVCELEEVACIRAPCPPLPRCVPIKTGPSCKTIKCMANHTCLDLPKGSTCVPIGESACNLIDCKEGTVCKLQEVACIRAPCPPIPQCVPANGPSCMTVKCSASTRCVETETGPVCKPIDGATTTQESYITSDLCLKNPELCEDIIDNYPTPETKPTSCEDMKTKTIKCAPNYKCVDTPKGPECVAEDGATPVVDTDGEITRPAEVPATSEKPAPSTETGDKGTTEAVRATTEIQVTSEPAESTGTAGPVCPKKCGPGEICMQSPQGPACFVDDRAEGATTTREPTTQAITDGGDAPTQYGPSCATMKCAASTTCVDVPVTGGVCQPNDKVTSASAEEEPSTEIPVTAEAPVQSTGSAGLVCDEKCGPGDTCIQFSPGEKPRCGHRDPGNPSTSAVDNESSTPAPSDSGATYTGLPPKPEFGKDKCSPGLVFAWNEKAARCLANGTQVCTEEDWEKVKGNTFGACMKNAPKIPPTDKNEKTDCGLGKVYAQVPGEPTAELYGRRCADAFCPKEATCVQEKTAAHCCIMPRWAHYGK